MTNKYIKCYWKW